MGISDDQLRSFRPSPWFVVMQRPWLLVWSVVLPLGLAWGLQRLSLGDAAGWVRLGAGVWWLGLAIWQLLEWALRDYSVTRDRVLVRSGVVRTAAADVPLRNVQHVTMTQSIVERVLGLGTVGVATAGELGPVVFLRMLRSPEGIVEAIRERVDGVQRSTTMAGEQANAADRPIVIGLAGGIGAGKSRVGAALADMGCLVIDSDKEAKAALDRPEVREQLVRWWGSGVVGADGRVDRAAVSRVIFGDPSERSKLEQLVHPLVRKSRGEMIAKVDPKATPAVVVDAPLLFEVGLDKECDGVIFVDAPREERLKRVRETRGWSAEEMERRENAQLPLEEKRRRSDEVVVNDSTEEALAARARAAFERLLVEIRASRTSRGA